MDMRAVGVRSFGDPESLELMSVGAPRPEPGEVLVKLSYSGINFIDVYMRNGTYAKSDTYKTPLPMILGMEGSGIVAEIADGVTGLQAGDRVAYCIHRGSYSEYAVVPAWKLVSVPDDIPLIGLFHPPSSCRLSANGRGDKRAHIGSFFRVSVQAVNRDHRSDLSAGEGGHGP